MQQNNVLPNQDNTKTGKKIRDPWFDNIRLFAALLIVVGHFISPMVKMENGWHLIWMMTWAMRVPVFVLISGYFSWDNHHTRKNLLSLVRNVFFVYLAFQIISNTLQGIHTGKWSFKILEPAFGLWFLLALLFWRLLLPYVIQIPFILSISFVLAIAVGFVPQIGGYLSLSRAIVLFPIFIVGFRIKQIGMRKLLDNNKARILAALIVICYWIFMYYCSGQYRRSFLGFGHAYEADYGPLLDQAVFRAFMLLISLVVGVATMTLIPRKKIPWFTYLGSGAFYIYLIHPLLFREARWHGVYDYISSDKRAIAFVILALGISLLCASAPVRKLLAWLVQPKYYVPLLSEKK